MNKYLTMGNEQLAQELIDYSKDKKGEIRDITYAAGITIRGMRKASAETSEEYLQKIEKVSSEICDKYCKYPNECEDGDNMINTICVNCPLSEL